MIKCKHFHIDAKIKITSSSSSSSSRQANRATLADPFQSHTTSSLLSGLPGFFFPFLLLVVRAAGYVALLLTRIHFFSWSYILSNVGVMFSSLAISVFVLWSVRVYPAALAYFISAVILLASLALIVQFSPLYNSTRSVSVLHSFILVWTYCL
jgi:hypothetical protein